MSKSSGCCSKLLVPADPLPPGAHEFSKKVTTLLDGQPKDEATVSEALAGHDELLDAIAAGMYTLASMLVGEGEESVRVIETSIAKSELTFRSDPEESRRNSRRALAAASIRLLTAREPGCLDAPVGMEFPHTCIEDDELDAAGVSSEQLQTMIEGRDRSRVRAWLESLPVQQRVVFVMRAVAGMTTRDVAALLEANGGPGAAGWTFEHVREVFRQALCSLASQLLHASHASH